MEIVCAIGMLMAFLLGAWVRKPFLLHAGEKQTPREPEAGGESQERMRIQQENLLNYGISGYRQKEIDDEN